MKLKIIRNFSFVIQVTEEKDEVETFKKGDIHDVDLLDDYRTVVDIQFGDGSVAYSFPKDAFEIIEE